MEFNHRFNVLVVCPIMNTLRSAGLSASIADCSTWFWRVISRQVPLVTSLSAVGGFSDFCRIGTVVAIRVPCPQHKGSMAPNSSAQSLSGPNLGRGHRPFSPFYSTVHAKPFRIVSYCIAVLGNAVLRCIVDGTRFAFLTTLFPVFPRTSQSSFPRRWESRGGSTCP